MTSPWFITEADAAARDAKVLEEFKAAVRSTETLAPDAAMMRLAKLGYEAAEVRRLHQSMSGFLGVGDYLDI